MKEVYMSKSLKDMSEDEITSVDKQIEAEGEEPEEDETDNNDFA